MKKAFKKAFHEESRRPYDNEKTEKEIRKEVKRLKSMKDSQEKTTSLSHTIPQR